VQARLSWRWGRRSIKVKATGKLGHRCAVREIKDDVNGPPVFDIFLKRKVMAMKRGAVRAGWL